MADYHDELSPLESGEPEPRPRGRALLAWSVILLLVAVVVRLQMVRPGKEGGAEEASVTTPIFQMESRYLVGAANLTGQKGSQLLAQADALNTGPVENRWRFIAIAGELGGPDAALEDLKKLEDNLARHQIELTPAQQTVRELLGKLYQDYAKEQWEAPSLRPEDRDLLREQLGWFGDLALAPAQGPEPETRQAVLRPAFRTMYVFLGLFLALILAGFAGLVGLLVLLLLAFSGRMRSGLDLRRPHGGIYAETFALWMIVFLALNGAVGVLEAKGVLVPQAKLLVLCVANLLSLATLAWPVLRGIPWAEVREEIGLTWGRQPFLEPVLGAGCYLMTVPLMIIGLMGTLIIMSLQKASMAGGSPEDNFGPSGIPFHPIIEDVAQGAWWARLQILFLASVVAPIVEETMFRGVLYRNLREASSRLGTLWSFLVSGSVVSVLFAVIHPQGLVAVPALAFLAMGLTIAREWRGTLIPGMVAHGINNGLLMIGLMALTGD